MSQTLGAYWIWLGPVLSETEMLFSPAVSPAANRWQIGLLKALRTAGQQIAVVSYLPEPLWPRGRLIPFADHALALEGLEMATVRYLNLPGLRNTSLRWGHARALRQLTCRLGRPAVVLSYNVQSAYSAVALRAQEKHAVPWVPVAADVPDERLSRMRYENRIDRAAGRVFLSWAKYRDCEHTPKLHLDGGVERFLTYSEADTGRRAFLYAGAMAHYGGLDLLVEAFKLIPDPDVELWICGKGENPAAIALASKDRRVKLFGLVPEDRLVELSKSAFAFINPRPVDTEASRNTFPSKVLEYLSYGKPIISTWTDGLAPVYRDVLVTLEEATPMALATKMKEILTWDRRRRHALRQRIADFIALDRLWSVQARRLVEWINSEIVRR